MRYFAEISISFPFLLSSVIHVKQSNTYLYIPIFPKTEMSRSLKSFLVDENSNLSYIANDMIIDDLSLVMQRIRTLAIMARI